MKSGWNVKDKRKDDRSPSPDLRANPKNRQKKVTTRSLETESTNIIKTVASNKVGLSKRLDTTLKSSHDMKVFGLGTAASMASRER